MLSWFSFQYSLCVSLSRDSWAHSNMCSSFSVSIAIAKGTKNVSYQPLPAGLPNAFDSQLLTQETNVHHHFVLYKTLQVYSCVDTLIEMITFLSTEPCLPISHGLWLKDDEINWSNHWGLSYSLETYLLAGEATLWPWTLNAILSC